VAARGAHHLNGQGRDLAVLLGVLVLHGDRGGNQHLPEVSGEPHAFPVVLRSSGEAQVRQAESVHHVGLVDAGAQLGGAAQSTGHAVVPVEVAVMLPKGSPAEESRQHDLTGGGRGVEADGAQHGALALGEEGHGLLCHEVVKVKLVTVVRQDRGPQVAITADVDVGLAVLAGVLDQGGPEHGLEAVEVSGAVEEFCTLSVAWCTTSAQTQHMCFSTINGTTMQFVHLVGHLLYDA
jgi:hypothetical protein